MRQVIAHDGGKAEVKLQVADVQVRRGPRQSSSCAGYNDYATPIPLGTAGILPARLALMLDAAWDHRVGVADVGLMPWARCPRQRAPCRAVYTDRSLCAIWPPLSIPGSILLPTNAATPERSSGDGCCRESKPRVADRHRPGRWLTMLRRIPEAGRGRGAARQSRFRLPERSPQNTGWTRFSRGCTAACGRSSTLVAARVRVAVVLLETKEGAMMRTWRSPSCRR